MTVVPALLDIRFPAAIKLWAALRDVYNTEGRVVFAGLLLLIANLICCTE